MISVLFIKLSRCFRRGRELHIRIRTLTTIIILLGLLLLAVLVLVLTNFGQLVTSVELLLVCVEFEMFVQQEVAGAQFLLR